MVTFDAVAPIFSSSGNGRSRSHPIWMQFLLKVWRLPPTRSVQKQLHPKGLGGRLS
ncbi:hypothetical protein NG796_09475 [Laspinema sp. A4]|uniref:hypothetical protein n=1 Tax=Laspinema sp. D2d TaxID=2953686 RepID=UPI0021BAEAA0|nr:hypothetical protein [Laspinema sp. D2d]MCT7983526.1 hypothetical protein [Laspinema sp. D2d]